MMLKLLTTTLPCNTLGFMAIALVILLVFVILLGDQRRGSIPHYFSLLKSRLTLAHTPPRPLSPSAKQSNASEPDYRDSFPPPRRHALAQILDSLCASKPEGPSKPDTVALEKNQRCLIPIDIPFDQLPADNYSPTGISVADIRALGPFPDYAALSGVPPPECSSPESDLSRTTFRPYRPFRWPYHQTMSLNKLESDFWLELEKTYVERVHERQILYEQKGTQVLNALPGSELACREVMEMVLQFYVQRFPQFFSLSSDRKVFHNALLKTETDLAKTSPLQVLLDNCPEDFAVMQRDSRDGMYYLRAGVICSSIGWNLGTKMGKQLRDVHEPVPDYRAKMQFSMDRYFAKMPTDKPIQRGSWGLEAGCPLYMGPDDPHLELRDVQDPNLSVDDIKLRVDWQTLRRVPLSGAVVFNFKCVFSDMRQFHGEPGIPALLVRILEGAEAGILKYKGTKHIEHVALPALRAWAKEQETDEQNQNRHGEVHTLTEHPFFPGWRAKWMSGEC